MRKTNGFLRESVKTAAVNQRSNKRTATNEASQVMLPLEYSQELLGDSDVDVIPEVQVEVRTEILASELSHSVLEHDEQSNGSEQMYVELLKALNQPRSGFFFKEVVWPEKA